MQKIVYDTSSVRQLVKEYEGGMTLARLAKRERVSIPTMRRTLVEGGAKMRPRGRRPQ
jgi:hypothetical protein